MRYYYLPVIIVSIVWLSSCTPSGPVHNYPGEKRPRSETALLRVPGPISVMRIDRKSIDVPSITEGYYDIYLEPGLHRIDFRYELYWGDATAGSLVWSDIVAIETQFNAGMTYEITYPEPDDEEQALGMANTFKAKLIEKQTGRQVASRSASELSALGVSTSLFYSYNDSTQTPIDNTTTNESVNTGAVKNNDANAVADKDAVKRLKFWWLIANDDEHQHFIEWMKVSASLDTTPPKDIDAKLVAGEDAVKRLKFWWLMANEEDQRRFREWMQTSEGKSSN